jgi:hypothetical protein
MVALMARATEWRRVVGEYVESVTKANQHFFQLPSIDEGETIGRIRFTWQAQFSASTSAEGVGLGVAAGIIVVAAGTSTGAMPYPNDNPDADWLWWEFGLYQPMLVGHTEATIGEIDAFPTGDCTRDARAQRKADVGGSDVWFQTQNTGLASSQTDHYLSVAASMLVILPA